MAEFSFRVLTYNMLAQSWLTGTPEQGAIVSVVCNTCAFPIMTSPNGCCEKEQPCKADQFCSTWRTRCSPPDQTSIQVDCRNCHAGTIMSHQTTNLNIYEKGGRVGASSVQHGLYIFSTDCALTDDTEKVYLAKLSEITCVGNYDCKLMLVNCTGSLTVADCSPAQDSSPAYQNVRCTF